MKLAIMLVIIGTIFLTNTLTVFAQHSAASGELYGYNVTITSSGGGNLTGTNFSYNVVIGEPVIGNATGTEFAYAFGFFHVVNRVFNFTGITICVETWECTGWVENGTFEYRSCTDTSACGTELLKPDTSRRAMSANLIVLLPITMAVLLFGMVLFIDKEEHQLLRFLLMISGVAMIIPLFMFIYALQDTTTSTAVLDAIDRFLRPAIFLIVAIMMYFAYYIVIKILRSMQKKKLEKLNY